MRLIARQAFRYGLVGLASTAINYVLFTGGIAIGVHYLISATFSSIVTVLFGYFFNRTFTFSAPGNANLTEFFSFIGVFFVQYAIAMVGYALLIGFFGMNPSLAFVINNSVIVIVAYTLLSQRTFKR